MISTYRHLNAQQRYAIHVTRKTKRAYRTIAGLIGVSPSTICRARNRNQSELGYRPNVAEHLAARGITVIDNTRQTQDANVGAPPVFARAWRYEPAMFSGNRQKSPESGESRNGNEVSDAAGLRLVASRREQPGRPEGEMTFVGAVCSRGGDHDDVTGDRDQRRVGGYGQGRHSGLPLQRARRQPAA